MSTQTIRHRTALQRANVRWQARRAQLRLVSATAPKAASLGDRLCILANRIHDDPRPWIVAALILLAGDLYYCALAFGWLH